MKYMIVRVLANGGLRWQFFGFDASGGRGRNYSWFNRKSEGCLFADKADAMAQILIIEDDNKDYPLRIVSEDEQPVAGFVLP